MNKMTVEITYLYTFIINKQIKKTVCIFMLIDISLIIIVRTKKYSINFAEPF